MFYIDYVLFYIPEKHFVYRYTMLTGIIYYFWELFAFRRLSVNLWDFTVVFGIIKPANNGKPKKDKPND